MEATIADEFPVVVSKETADGGKDGTMTEVPRRMAAKLVVDGHGAAGDGGRDRRRIEADAGGGEAGGGAGGGGGAGCS